MTMDIRALESSKGDFYVPSYSIAVSGKDLLRDYRLTITSVEIDLKLNVPGRFSFTVTNAFDWSANEFLAFQAEERVDLRELFEFGKIITIAMGYGDYSQLDVLINGIITEIGTSFSQDGSPELTISGYDRLYFLTLGKYTKNWKDTTNRDVVKNIAEGQNMKPKVLLSKPEKDPTKPRIDQNQQSDIEFLDKTLAKETGSVFYLRENDQREEIFYFGKRNNDKSKVIELSWGKGLLSFSPEANLAGQVTTVVVTGRSAEKGKDIVGRATKGDETGRETNRKSGAEKVTTALGNPTVLKIRAAVHSQDEADARAEAILEERAQKFLKGSGESIGLPEIVPDSNISLDGIGTAFSKTYYVNQSTHKIDTNGYSTSFNVEETSL